MPKLYSRFFSERFGIIELLNFSIGPTFASLRFRSHNDAYNVGSKRAKPYYSHYMKRHARRPLCPSNKNDHCSRIHFHFGPAIRARYSLRHTGGIVFSVAVLKVADILSRVPRGIAASRSSSPSFVLYLSLWTKEKREREGEEKRERENTRAIVLFTIFPTDVFSRNCVFSTILCIISTVYAHTESLTYANI